MQHKACDIAFTVLNAFGLRLWILCHGVMLEDRPSLYVLAAQ